MPEPSAAYFAALDATKQHHLAHKTFSGRFLAHYLGDIEDLVLRYNCRTMLDYGCGKGIQWRPEGAGRVFAEARGLDVTLFDPGVAAYSRPPEGKFDIVIATQVLGSVPAADLKWVTGELARYASKVFYVAERLGPTKKRLHAHMDAEMPREWSFDRWTAAISLGNCGVDGYLRTRGTEKRFGQIAWAAAEAPL